MKLRALSSLKIGASLSVGASLIGAALLSAPMAALATEPGTVYVTPFIGNEQYSSERSIPWTMQYGIGGEYQITEQLGVEIDYMHSMDGDTRYNGYDVDISRLSLDGIWSFGRFGFKNIYEPYAKVGLGHVDYNYRQGGTSNDQDTDIDAGVGMRFHLTDRLSTRLEAKAIYETQSYQTQGLYTVGFSYSFGGAKPAAAARAAAVVAPAAPLDSDSDGVIDANDKCPNTPQGRTVDANGCQALIHESKEVTLRIEFAHDSAVIPEAYVSEVEKAATFLNKHPEIKAELAGYTDSTGADKYNEKLSQRRAESVQDMLVKRFAINPARLTAKGYGAANPVVSNDTAEGRAQNRRVVAKADVEVTTNPN